VHVHNTAAYSSNFVVGLTNSAPSSTPPTLWEYTLCGRYPGSVAADATVSVRCQDNLAPFRYVIVQFPRTSGNIYFREVEVFALGMKSSAFIGLFIFATSFYRAACKADAV